MSQKEEYDLEESFAKLGALPIPILVDLKGTHIDGFNRTRIKAKVPVVKIPLKNQGQLHILRLVINCCRRIPSEEEITRELVAIAEFYGWKSKQLCDNLPFDRKWILKYLPDKYKEPEKVQAGKKSGEARRALLEKHRKSQDAVQSERTDLVTLEQPAEIPSVEKFCESFESTFSSHLSRFTGLPSSIITLAEKDLPVIFDYMDEKHNCEECPMVASCKRLVQFYRGEHLLKVAQALIDFHNKIPTLVPGCIKAKINETP